MPCCTGFGWSFTIVCLAATFSANNFVKLGPDIKYPDFQTVGSHLTFAYHKNQGRVAGDGILSNVLHGIVDENTTQNIIQEKLKCIK